MKIFKVSCKSALTSGDICLSSGLCLLEMLASHSFLFPSFCCSFSCSRCGLLCTFYIQTTSTLLDSSLQNHLLKLRDGRSVFAVCWESRNIYQDEIRIKSAAGKDYFWLSGQFSTALLPKSRNIYWIINICEQTSYKNGQRPRISHIFFLFKYIF